MFGLRPFSICQTCPRVRLAAASSALAERPSALRATRIRPPRVLVAMTTTIVANTSVVNAPRAKAVDRGSRLVQYVLVSTLKERLQKVIDDGRVEGQRPWARAAGLESETHIGRLLQGTAADEGKVQLRILEALAEAACVSPAWLAFGVGGPDDDPPVATLLMKLRRLPGLEEAIERHPGRWRTSTVARITAETFQSDSDGIPIGGWERALDAIESGRSSKMKGDAADVTRAARKQVGRRPKLPRRV